MCESDIFKVYFAERRLMLSSSLPTDSSVKTKQVSDRHELRRAIVQALESQEEDVWICSNQYPDLVKEVKLCFDFIQAAGGIVRNEDGEVLFILKKGKWDLPKGKLESYESYSRAAVREVQEETGLQKVEPEERVGVTYHFYQQEQQWILKETHWFSMFASIREPLFPDYHEDITVVKWIPSDDLPSVLLESYRSLREFLHETLFPST